MGLHATNPEITLAGAVGFVSIGKAITAIAAWLGINAEVFAAVSYILASLAALMTIYYTWKKNHPPKG